LSRKPTDPKLDAVLYILQERGWLDLGCIIFSQYYDTAYWVAESLTGRLPGERVALYAGADKSGVFFDGEWRTRATRGHKGRGAGSQGAFAGGDGCSLRGVESANAWGS
jgi:hypothetical protein